MNVYRLRYHELGEGSGRSGLFSAKKFIFQKMLLLLKRETDLKKVNLQSLERDGGREGGGGRATSGTRFLFCLLFLIESDPVA